MGIVKRSLLFAALKAAKCEKLEHVQSGGLGYAHTDELLRAWALLSACAGGYDWRFPELGGRCWPNSSRRARKALEKIVAHLKATRRADGEPEFVADGHEEHRPYRLCVSYLHTFPYTKCKGIVEERHRPVPVDDLVHHGFQYALATRVVEEEIGNCQLRVYVEPWLRIAESAVKPDVWHRRTAAAA